MNQELAPSEERLSEALLVSIEDAINREVKNVPDGTVAAAFISDEEMHKLNKAYRDKDKTTDVLSFSYIDDEDAETIGDVVISFDQAVRQAENGVQQELAMLLTHGVLHVLGYDHETEEDAAVMFPIQDKIVDQVV